MSLKVSLDDAGEVLGDTLTLNTPETYDRTPSSLAFWSASEKKERCAGIYKVASRLYQPPRRLASRRLHPSLPRREISYASFRFTVSFRVTVSFPPNDNWLLNSEH
jgi:hypothetical protein